MPSPTEETLNKLRQDLRQLDGELRQFSLDWAELLENTQATAAEERALRDRQNRLLRQRENVHDTIRRLTQQTLF